MLNVILLVNEMKAAFNVHVRSSVAENFLDFCDGRVTFRVGYYNGLSNIYLSAYLDDETLFRDGFCWGPEAGWSSAYGEPLFKEDRVLQMVEELLSPALGKKESRIVASSQPSMDAVMGARSHWVLLSVMAS